MAYLKTISRQLTMTLFTLILVLGTAMTLANGAAYLLSASAFQEFFGPRDPAGARFAFAMLHIAPAMVALAVGPFQFWKAFRRASVKLHRLIGVIYVLSIATSATASLVLAPYALGGWQAGLGFGTLAVLWLATTLMGFGLAVKGKIQQHREWMLRSFCLTCAGVLFRIELIVLDGVLGWDYVTAYRFGAWACWVPIVVCVEVWIRAKPTARSRP